MKLTQVLFVFRRAWKSLGELFWTHTLTSGTMAMTLFILGGFLLIQENLQGLLKGWGSQIQLFAYLKDSPSPGGVKPLVDQIRSYPEVESVRFVSKAEAWEEFKKSLGAQSGVIEGLSAEVLPSSLEITLKGPYRNRAAVDNVAGRLRRVGAIGEVEYPHEWIEKFSLLVLGVQWAQWLLGGFLFIATLLIVGSTVKLAILARQDEIEIMQLVGAPPGLIKAPFVLEGMVQGIAGAALALFFLWLLFLFFSARLPSSFWVFIPRDELHFLAYREISLLLLIGLAMGAGGSLSALRRFLRIGGRG